MLYFNLIIEFQETKQTYIHKNYSMILLYKRKETKLKEQTLTNMYKRRLIPGKGVSTVWDRQRVSSRVEKKGSTKLSRLSIHHHRYQSDAHR